MNLLVWLDAPLVLLGLTAVVPRLWSWSRGRANRPHGPGRQLQSAMAVLFYLGLSSLGMAACDVGLAAWEMEHWFGCDESEKRTGLFAPGTEAPDFSLPSLQSGRSVRLSDFRGHKPIVLFFGSFT